MLASDFWKYVDRSGGEDACWPWMRAINKSGYGSVWISGRARTASRFAFEIENGPIPSADSYHGNVVMHSCDNRKCCNPKHLSLGSQGENNRDRDQKGRVRSRKKGEQNHHSRFSEADVVEIKKRLSCGQSLQSIADLFGCSKSAINHIKAGRVWGWLGQAALERARAK